MNLDHARTISGWMDEAELEYLAHLARKSLVIAELGSWRGRSTVALAENTSGVVFSIDTRENDHLRPTGEGIDGDSFSEFQKNTRDIPNIIPVVSTTDKAAHIFKQTSLRFGAIFVDACHDYEQVRRDILNWRPLLTENGVLAGHDFIGDYPGVAQAVRELIPEFRLIHSIWSTEKI